MGIVLVLRAGIAGAQSGSQQPDTFVEPPDRVWEIEVHGGTVVPFRGAGGSQNLPVTGSVVSGQISVSTFYFGAGAQLFNQNQTSVAGASAPTIAPFDAIVIGPAIEWQRWAGTAGVRLSRSLNSRFGLEFSGDYTRSTLVFTQDAVNATEATRASFVPALTRALASGSIPSTASSVAMFTDNQSAPQVFATAAVLVNLRTAGKAIPYVVGGGGAVFTYGSTPAASLIGTYQLGASSQVSGTDTVDLQYEWPVRDFVIVGGGGLKFHASPGWGIRVDGRAQIVRNQGSNLVSVTPASALRSGGVPNPIITSGTLQFSSTAPLTGPLLSSIKSFDSSGPQVYVNITAGLFWRF